jgi:hypothetical protein
MVPGLNLNEAESSRKLFGGQTHAAFLVAGSFHASEAVTFISSSLSAFSLKHGFNKNWQASLLHIRHEYIETMT